MTRNLFASLAVIMIAALLCSNGVSDMEDPEQEVEHPSEETIEFAPNTATFAGMTLPWREAVISGTSSDTKIVIYLHGGSARGNDNISQMNEPGPMVIAEYLQKNGMNAIILVPQCPKSLSWGGKTNPALKELIENYISKTEGTIKVYGFGGSMGGTGTGSLVSAYPEIFTAVMPVAWNSSMADATKMAKVPLYTVMGSADDLMDSEKVSNFVDTVKNLGGTAEMEIESGWTHGDTCKKSYTDARLKWVFER